MDNTAKIAPAIAIELQDSALSLAACEDYTLDPGAGGMTFFVGRVRNQTQGRPVLQLEFEAYGPMAISEMRKIAEGACKKWPVRRICIHHRVGVLEVGEAAVIIGVAAAHRGAAFAACQYAIDTLKETVPIWKKEIFADGEVWVAAHP